MGRKYGWTITGTLSLWLIALLPLAPQALAQSTGVSQGITSVTSAGSIPQLTGDCTTPGAGSGVTTCLTSGGNAFGSAAFSDLPTVAAFGDFGPLVGAGVKYHALPVGTGAHGLICTGTTAGNPYIDIFSGTLGAATPTYNLATTGCADDDQIILFVQQGASAISFGDSSVTTSAAGGKIGSGIWNLGSASGSLIMLAYTSMTDASGQKAWLVTNGGTVPLQPWLFSQMAPANQFAASIRMSLLGGM